MTANTIYVVVAIAIFFALEFMFVRVAIKHALKKLTVSKLVEIFAAMPDGQKAAFMSEATKLLRRSASSTS